MWSTWNVLIYTFVLIPSDPQLKKKTLASFLQPIWNIFIISPILWCCQQQIPKTSRKTSLRCSVVTTILNPPSKKKNHRRFFFQIQILTAPRLFGFQGLIIHLFDGFQQETSLRHQGLEVFWEKNWCFLGWKSDRKVSWGHTCFCCFFLGGKFGRCFFFGRVGKTYHLEAWKRYLTFFSVDVSWYKLHFVKVETFWVEGEILTAKAAVPWRWFCECLILKYGLGHWLWVYLTHLDTNWKKHLDRIRKGFLYQQIVPLLWQYYDK